jgi:hypothetical protein
MSEWDAKSVIFVLGMEFIGIDTRCYPLPGNPHAPLS